MLGVAKSHALQSSGPIVMKELYLLPEDQRKIVSRDVDISVTPTTEFSDTFEIEADSSGWYGDVVHCVVN